MGMIVLVQVGLGTDGLATEVALDGLLAHVRAQVQIEIGLLGKSVAAEFTDRRPLTPVLDPHEHLQAISVRGWCPPSWRTNSFSTCCLKASSGCSSLETRSTWHRWDRRGAWQLECGLCKSFVNCSGWEEHV